MAFLGKGKKQDMLQLAEELGINATLNMTVPSIKIAITNSEGYEEEFVKNLYETIIANGKRLEELERAEKMRLEELVKEQALKEKELQLKFDLERFKIESGFRTKAAVCGNHLNQHGRYLLGNKTAELRKGNLGYNFLPVEILNAVQTRSQVKAAREERGIDSGDAKKKGKMSEEIKPLYEQAASQVQVTNQVYSLEKELLVKNREDKLGNVVKSILLALRTVSHESTGYTPSELVYGKNLRTPETLVMEHWMEPEEEGDLVTEYMFKLINRLKRCQEVAINKMEEMQVKRKTW
ncbi:retrovirus-related Pol polyprotein from transposon 17.6 [Trichonephila clavipes]|nr:retrovirus-related Pol polyprotein from transposon 17.6 [Trichonephila clavipes]